MNCISKCPLIWHIEYLETKKSNMVAIDLNQLYVFSFFPDIGMSYIVFHIFRVKDYDFTTRNDIAAMCIEKAVNCILISMASDKHSCL